MSKYSYEILEGKYRLLQDKYKALSKIKGKEIRIKDNTIKELKKRMEGKDGLIRYKNDRLREKDLIIGELLIRLEENKKSE